MKKYRMMFVGVSIFSGVIGWAKNTSTATAFVGVSIFSGVIGAIALLYFYKFFFYFLKNTDNLRIDNEVILGFLVLTGYIFIVVGILSGILLEIDQIKDSLSLIKTNQTLFNKEIDESAKSLIQKQVVK